MVTKAPEELFDHELNRLPVTKAMKDQVSRAAKAANVSVASYIRWALSAQLKRDLGKRSGD